VLDNVVLSFVAAGKNAVVSVSSMNVCLQNGCGSFWGVIQNRSDTITRKLTLKVLCPVLAVCRAVYVCGKGFVSTDMLLKLNSIRDLLKEPQLMVLATFFHEYERGCVMMSSTRRFIAGL
jgi:hypothetical protein